MFKELFTERKQYKLIDFDGKEVKYFDFHGNEMRVIAVLKDSIIASGPDGEEIELGIKEIKSQDDTIKEIK